MRRKGVVYDAGCVTGVTWRPDYTPALARRELEIIKTGLHCNAVRIRARDTGRLTAAAGAALRQGLEVWFCPELWDKSPDATLRHITRSAAAAEEPRARWPGQLVFCAGNGPLNAFLARASAAVREEFRGPVSYASLPFERADWDMFDINGTARPATGQDRPGTQ